MNSTFCQPKLVFQFMVLVMKLTVASFIVTLSSFFWGEGEVSSVASHLQNEDLYAQTFFLPVMAICIWQG